MSVDQKYLSDVEAILSHRYDNGGDYWTTADHKLLKGAPYTTLESALYLLELGVSPADEILKNVAELIFSNWKSDGRIKMSPTGGIYPCHTALAAKTLCCMGYSSDDRIEKSFLYFLETQQEDGGWKCEKYSFGKGEETKYSTPYTTLVTLDLFRYSRYFNRDPRLDKAVNFLLEHWVIRKPISPCHYGIGSLFMQIEYPFRGYNLFYYVYVLSFYESAKKDKRFLEALKMLELKTVQGELPVERVVPKLARLEFCKKGQTSELATRRYQEILKNIS
ncbi:MAG: prenyltransferase [Muricomes sp.]